MKESSNNSQIRKRRWFSRLTWIPAIILVAFLLMFSVLQVPYVQTKLVNSISEYVSEVTGYDINLKYTNFTWYDFIVVEGVTINDLSNNRMISVEEMQIDFRFFDFILNKQFNAEYINLDRPEINIIKESDSLAVNISAFIYALNKLGSSDPNKKKTTLNVSNILINNGIFTYNDLRQQPIKSGKDYYHFRYDSVNVNLKDFTYAHDTLQLEFISMNGVDTFNHLDINSLKGNFLYTRNALSLYDFKLKTPSSTIGDSLVLFYDHPNQLKYFKDSIDFFVHFDKAKFNTSELALFAPKLRQSNQLYDISGNFNGSVKKLNGQNVQLQFGQSSRMEGNLAFSGLPNLNETFIEISCKNALINPSDVLFYIPGKYRERVLNAGVIDFKGEFFGFLSDFVAAGEFDTKAGYLASDINLKITEEGSTQYSGKLELKEFDLGIILSNSERYQKINLSGNIAGQGIQINTADFHLNASVDSVGILGYNYKNIYTNGDFSEGYFKGEIQTHDPNLVFNGDVTIDLKDNNNKFNVNASLDTLNLKPLGFSTRDVFIGSKIDADFKGLHIDSLRGYVNLRDNHIKIDSKTLGIDSVKLLSYLIQGERHINLETDGLSGELQGNFKNTTVIRRFRTMVREIGVQLVNDQDKITEFYAEYDSTSIDKFAVDLKINLWNLNKFIRPFYSNINVSRDITIEGKYISDTTSIFELYSNIDTIQWNNSSFIGNTFEFELNKNNIEHNINSSLYLGSKEQQWPKITSTERLYLESEWADSVMNISGGIFQPRLENKATAIAQVNFLTDTTSLKISHTDIDVFKRQWKIDPDNILMLHDSILYASNFKFWNSDQSIAFNGYVSEDPDKSLLVEFEALEMDNINPISPINIAGTLDGFIELNKLSNDYLLQSNLKGNSILLDDFLVGNFHCISDWESTNERLNIKFDVDRNNKRIIDIDGFIYPLKSNDQLDLSARFEKANLDIAEPFLKKRFSGVSGFASGHFDIDGNIKSPVLLGSGKVEEGIATVNYLHTTYTFDGDLIFSENEIGVSNLVLHDNEKNSAILNGGVFHDGFKDFIIDIEGEYDQFKVLSTTSIDNRLYYGTAYATGSINFLGAINNLQINAKARTNKGTRISIPIGDLSEYSIDEKEYISFVELDKIEIDKKIKQNIQEEIDLKGLRLDFDLEITNDAYAELIFDVTAGDIIRGRGNGNINLQIDTNGEFNMFGDFQIEQGGYNFTLYNIINKEFDIQNGSSISWYGDPYGARLNIDAKYRQLASLAPMITDLDADNLNSPQLRRKYPSIVDLNLKGALLSPEISFDINIEDYPNDIELNDGTTIDLQTVISAFKAKLNQNEQEMKRQVFSLVILRKFSPENNFSVNSQTIGNSLSEFVSNQLSYWATQVDENLEVDVNLAGLDEDAFNTFQLRLSYTFLDGRLRVTRGGGFSDQQNNSDLGTIIGDWTVEYLLTPDGRFRAKMYSRTNLNAANAQLGEDNTQTGFSLQFIRSFDELKQILTDSRSSNKETLKKPAQPPKNETTTKPTSNNIQNEAESVTSGGSKF